MTASAQTLAGSGACLSPAPAVIDKAYIRSLRPDGPWTFAPAAEPEKARTFFDLGDAEDWATEQSGNILFMPFGPANAVNMLDVQRNRASVAEKGSWTGRAAMFHEKGRDELADRFAELNGWHVSVPFTLDALLRGMTHGGSWGHAYQYPGCSHLLFFRRGRQTAAIVSEPYRIGEVSALIDFAAANELICYLPPSNLKASFWFPGFTFFVVLMPRYAERPRFLNDQLRYPKGDVTLRDIVQSEI